MRTDQHARQLDPYPGIRNQGLRFILYMVQLLAPVLQTLLSGRAVVLICVLMACTF